MRGDICINRNLNLVVVRTETGFCLAQVDGTKLIQLFDENNKAYEDLNKLIDGAVKVAFMAGQRSKIEEIKSILEIDKEV